MELAELALMYLDSSFTVKMGVPGALHHARFMSKSRYYLRLMLLIEKATKVMSLSKPRVAEIKAMALYISIFHVPNFLSAEIPDIAAVQDFSTIWLMQKLKRMVPRLSDAASSVMKSLDRHQWYFDLTTVVFTLAN